MKRPRRLRNYNRKSWQKTKSWLVNRGLKKALLDSVVVGVNEFYYAGLDFIVRNSADSVLGAQRVDIGNHLVLEYDRISL